MTNATNGPGEQDRTVADDVLDILAPVEAIAQDMLDDDDEDVRRAAARALEAVAETRELVAQGDMRAVVEALDVGVQVGMLSEKHHARQAALIASIEQGLATVDVMIDQYPTYSVGSRVVAGHPAGRPHEVDPAVLHADVRAQLDAGDNLKRARKDVAKRHKVSVRTVQRATIGITR